MKKQDKPNLELEAFKNRILFDFSNQELLHFFVNRLNEDSMCLSADIEAALCYAENETDSYRPQKKEARARAKTYQKEKDALDLIIKDLEKASKTYVKHLTKTYAKHLK